MGEEVLQHDADRASRIAARCKRIQEKLAAVRQGDSAGGQEVVQQQGMTKTMQQLLKSSKRLIQLRFDTQQEVSAVKVQGDEQESMRRHTDERVRQELRAKLLAEAEAAAAANTNISADWATVLVHSVPQEMFNAIEKQRLACEAVIASKDALIADIRTALKAKDDNYVKLLRRQAADVDTMLAAMGQQLSQMTAAFREELQNVEGTLLQERADLLVASRKEISTLLEARAASESSFTDKYLAAVEGFAQNLEQLRHADAEEYQVLKIKLESDIALLEQHLETMRTTYQLNAEKLEYNYRVLLERDAENTATINQQKRKLSRQHDVLLTLKGKYTRSDSKYCDENSKLTEEYKRITEHFKDMQAKFCHFGKVDSAKYTQLWLMQQREACHLAQQLLAADRVIHQQQLGWQWQPPDSSLFVSPHDSSSATSPRAAAGSTALAGSSMGGSVSSSGSGAAAPGSSHASSRQPSSLGGVLSPRLLTGGVSPGGLKDSSSMTGGKAAALSSSGSPVSRGIQLQSSPEVVHRLAAAHNYGALCLLVDEAGFLLEEKTAALIAELPATEAKLVAAESIVRSLGVTDGPSFDALMEALSADAAANGSSHTGGTSVLVHPNEALLRLKQFVEAEAGVEQPALSATRAVATSIAPVSNRRSACTSQGRNSSSSPTPAPAGIGGCFQSQVISRRAANREREYWERLKNAVGEKVMRVWGKLEQQLNSYHSLLVQRGEGLAAIACLQQENEELRSVLNQYLSSKINSELQIPPMAVL